MKRLGQHFLVNKSVPEKIIDALSLQKDDVVIEIGPGKGALTLPLLEKCKEVGCKIIAVEKDKKLAYKMRRTANNERLEVIIGDILKELPKITKPFKVVGNIPYYITGKLLRIISELETKPKLTVLMVQKEVAERITAKPPRTNLLAAAVQFWAEPKILLTLKPNDFSPPPEVSSAVINLTPKFTSHELRTTGYYKFIRTLFKQPRKTILNNLSVSEISKTEAENKLKNLGIDPKSRPQNLSIKQIKQLSELFTN